ncbi:chain-length determining protein [Jeotgalibaca porci]|uniref:Capsular polysaccharide biosynthesis protein CpsC n=1 Tax=Jeotgalibaca porci TaxID=1868793 RepID=A0A6G7WG89_9LACT|nr:Wzz/FepE/Etk N-terminal domain-containing protein [Jeotgalibaca porci]QIK51227.1 chain-length determining protein [Jeotgalibaca porci]
MGEEISLGELFAILKRHIGKIITWSLAGLVLAAAYTFFFVTPQYESTSKIVVNQTQNTSQSITNTDIQTNLNLINTYQSIIKEPIILEDVINSTGSELSLEELRNKISVQTETSSLVFGISINDASPYTASELANATAQSFQTKIGDILEVESVTILSEATPNMKPVSPNTILNLIVGLILGLMIGVGLAFLLEFMDKRVKDTKIIEDLGWTNLGSILEMTMDEVKSTRIDKRVRTPKTSPSLSRRRV